MEEKQNKCKICGKILNETDTEEHFKTVHPDIYSVVNKDAWKPYRKKKKGHWLWG